MGIQKIREEFEKLPEIEKHLVFIDDFYDNKYHSMNNSSVTDFINGAWYAFQEQQNGIDLLRKQAKCHHTWHGKSENQYCSQCGLS